MQKNSVRLVSLKISFESMQKNDYPSIVHDEISRLHDLVFEGDPEETKVILEERIRQYPEVKEFYNYLTCVYQLAGHIEDMGKLAKRTCELFPNYLFGRCAYAAFCINNGQVDKIPEIFNHAFNLNDLYPDRDTFHVTEFTAFTKVMVHYFCKIGDLKSARPYLELLAELDPEDDFVQVATADLVFAFIKEKMAKMMQGVSPKKKKRK